MLISILQTTNEHSNGWIYKFLVIYLFEQPEIVTASTKPIKSFTDRNYMFMIILHRTSHDCNWGYTLTSKDLEVEKLSSLSNKVVLHIII
jgi:hypothetical protein